LDDALVVKRGSDAHAYDDIALDLRRSHISGELGA
jgi:hypothetical protein